MAKIVNFMLHVFYHNFKKKYLPTKAKRKKTTLDRRNLADTNLTKWSKLTLSLREQTHIMCLLLWCTDKERTLMQYFCQKCLIRIYSRGSTRQTQSEGHFILKITCLQSSTMLMPWKKGKKAGELIQNKED